MNLINGRALAEKIRAELKEKIAASGMTPGLGVILVGDDLASHLYVRLKEKAAAEIGIYLEKHIFAAGEPEEKIIQTIERLNRAPNIHGILIQLPLPSPLNPNAIIAAINPGKDADGFHLENIKALREGEPMVEPVLAKAVWRLIEEGGRMAHRPLKGQKTLIIGNSDAFTEPLEIYLKQKGLEAGHFHAGQIDKSRPEIKNYDIVVAAAGVPNFLRGDDFKHGAIVIDVGINRLPDGRLAGDVNFTSTVDKTGWITPVPGGVGPVTVAMLLANVFLLAQTGSQKIPPLASLVRNDRL